MTTSASTPRLRITFLWYLALVALTAVTHAPVPAALGALLDAAGFVLVVLSCLGRIWCSVFIAGRKDAELVTNGPYALCRHPLYSLSMLGSLGLGLATHSLLLTIATLAILGTLIAQAVVAEERYLAARHDTRFDIYRAQTPRYWPKRWQHHFPDTTPVRPVILWKAFVDASAFFLLFLLIVAARAWNETGVLSSPLTLP